MAISKIKLPGKTSKDDIHDSRISASDITGWNAKLSDAPSDGKQYARENGTWAEVEGGGTHLNWLTDEEINAMFE